MDIRLPLIQDFRIHAFGGGSVSELESGITNGMVEVREGISYLTQRPSIDISEDAGTDSKGRAIHYWDEATSLHIFNNGELFKGSYTTSISTSPTAGTKRGYFFELGTTLILVNPESDEAFTIATNGTVTEITDTDFPPKDTPAVGLAHGGAVLNNVLYVLTETGLVYGSDNGDATSWNALNFLGASRSNDGGVYLGKHHDNLAVMGPSTIELFYDAGNSTGSPLSRRQDVAYNIGCGSAESVWEVGDRMFFIGVTSPGMLGVYSLENFGLSKISDAPTDSFITQSIVKDGFEAVGSGFAAHGHWFYCLTLKSTPGDITPAITLVYDAVVNKWYEWDITVNDLSKFPIVDFGKREADTSRAGDGLFANGDIFTINDDILPLDSLLASTYWVDDYAETGYVTEASGSGTNIVMKSRTGMYDGGSNRYKYPSSLRFAGDRTPNSQTLTIKWADENNSSFNTGRSQDMSINSKEHRLGRFQRRNHEITYSGSDIVRIEALEMKLEVGQD
jgi:hypothetical protein